METKNYGIGCGCCDWMTTGLANLELAERHLIAHVRSEHPEALAEAQAHILDGLRPQGFDHVMVEDSYQVTCTGCHATQTGPETWALEVWTRDHLRDHHADDLRPRTRPR